MEELLAATSRLSSQLKDKEAQLASHATLHVEVRNMIIIVNFAHCATCLGQSLDGVPLRVNETAASWMGGCKCAYVIHFISCS